MVRRGQRTEYHPDPFALLVVERGEFEQVDEDGGVEDFDADVAVEEGGDQAGDDTDGVAKGLESVRSGWDAC